MTPMRFMHYIRKCKQVGLTQAVRSVYYKNVQNRFDQQWRQKALAKKANHTWDALAQNHGLDISFADFFKKLQQHVATLPFDACAWDYDIEYIVTQARKAEQKVFDILGSGPCANSHIPWHADIRLHTTHASLYTVASSATYYRDISVEVTLDKEMGTDIKVPWELSRFQHGLFLGRAYQETHDEAFVTAYAQQITDWIDQNPFLLGVNWVCPMEVALRAINWIYSMHFFCAAPIATQVWQKIICSLYDHYVYLEHTWEFYDGRTSNHYLSDLVGYFYLTWLFADLPGMASKRAWCFERINAEMDRQIFAEGTSYESSTHYHRLVTELLYHAYILAKTSNIDIPTAYYKKLCAMCEFITWCTPQSGELVAIGDNDSGSVLFGGLPQSIVQQYATNNAEGVHHYAQFGISIVKNNPWHITLRHHAYTQKQPSGHFHNDTASITLAYQGIPIIVDPGSFVYTASAYWRNYFRSAAMHATFFLENCEPVALDHRLFGLDIPENKYTTFDSTQGLLATQHDVYARYNLTAHREVTYDATSVRISDWWEQHVPSNTTPRSQWNFIFHPAIGLAFANNCWHIVYQNKPLLIVYSQDLVFKKDTSYYSPQYGVKTPCKVLRALRPTISLDQSLTVFHTI